MDEHELPKRSPESRKCSPNIGIAPAFGGYWAGHAPPSELLSCDDGEEIRPREGEPIHPTAATFDAQPSSDGVALNGERSLLNVEIVLVTFSRQPTRKAVDAMPIVSATEVKSHRIDYVIIGGGTAGLTLAARYELSAFLTIDVFTDFDG